MDASRYLVAAIASVPLCMMLAWILWALPPDGVSNRFRLQLAFGGTSGLVCIAAAVICWLETIH